MRVKNNYTKLLEKFKTNDFNNPEPVVYPNPAQSYIKINTPPATKTFDITVCAVSRNIFLQKAMSVQTKKLIFLFYLRELIY